MLEKFTKDEIKQIRKELKEIDKATESKFALKPYVYDLRESGITHCYEILNAAYIICDFTLGNYSERLTARNAGHVYYTVRNKGVETDADKYRNLFKAIVEFVKNNADVEAIRKAEAK